MFVTQECTLKQKLALGSRMLPKLKPKTCDIDLAAEARRAAWTY